jgi:Calcium/calmodulin dependent protein kinase II association domain
MKLPCIIFIALLVSFGGNTSTMAADNEARLAELDRYWAEVARAVSAGDFEGYNATCHKEGVLVSGVKKQSEPLSDALKRWEKDFASTKSGKLKATVEFRFSQRLGDRTTAHETGIFRYSTVGLDGKRQDEYIQFEGLLVKKDGEWMILMEYQKSKVSFDEWKALE